MKKALSLLLAALFLVGALVACNRSEEAPLVSMVHGQYPHYENVQELANHASYIVRVQVLDERVERLNVALPPRTAQEDAGMPYSPRYDITTIYRLSVLEVFQGDVSPDDRLEVRILGGRLGAEEVINLDHPGFAIGDDVVLFLYRIEESTLPPVLLSPWVSSFRVSEGADLAERATDEVLENVAGSYAWELTVGDLFFRE